jgi:hypothetical protein
MARDWVRHARMFFNLPDLDLAPGTFALALHDKMRGVLGRDYEAMAGMVFGAVPRIDDVLSAISEFEPRVNQPS